MISYLKTSFASYKVRTTSMRKLTMTELNRLPVADFKATPKSPVVLVLDNVRSLHNVGAVFRTADAFALEKIYLCGVTGQPPTAK